MKMISEALLAHIQSEVTTLATCWKLTRKDNTTLGFTNHDVDLLIDGVLYKASTGFTPTAIETTGDLSVDNLDVEGILTSGSLTEQDILAGFYDFADIEIFQVNYKDLSQGKLTLKCGWLGEVSIKKRQFVAEVRGMTQKLSQTIGELYSPACRASLGDGRCKINLELHTVTGSVTHVTSNQHFADNAREEVSGIFTSGVIQFTSGANNGVRMEVKEYLQATAHGGELVLVLPLPFAVQAGDDYVLTKGCDKTLATCAGRFNNLLNFRGEPHVPGLDRMLETAGTRSL